MKMLRLQALRYELEKKKADLDEARRLPSWIHTSVQIARMCCSPTESPRICAPGRGGRCSRVLDGELDPFIPDI